MILVSVALTPKAMAAGTVSVYSYAGGTVTTGAYVTQWVATPVAASHIEICDTSTKVIKVAVGPVGSEKDLATATVSGCVVISTVYVPAGSRIAIEAVDASATTGYNLLSLF